MFCIYIFISYYLVLQTPHQTNSLIVVLNILKSPLIKDFSSHFCAPKFMIRKFCYCSYLILAPAIMQSEKDPKKSAGACLESTKLDPDFYRLGHTKARIKFLYNNFSPFHHILSFMIHHKVFKISTKMNFF